MSSGSAWRRWLPPIVSLALIGWLATRTDPQALLAALDARSVLALAAVLLGYGAFTLLLEAASLKRLLPADASRLSLLVAARVKAASYLLGILHYALGVGALSYLLARRSQLSLAGALGVVALISALDLGVLLALTIAGVSTLGPEAPALRASVVSVAGIGLLGMFVVLRAPWRAGALERLRSLAALRALAETPTSQLARVALLRVGFVCSFVSLIGASLVAFGARVSLAELVVGTAVVSLVGALPAVAGRGTTQAAFLFVFRRSAPQETLLACSLTLSAGLILMRAGMGALFAREYVREARASREAQA